MKDEDGDDKLSIDSDTRIHEAGEHLQNKQGFRGSTGFSTGFNVGAFKTSSQSYSKLCNREPG